MQTSRRGFFGTLAAALLARRQRGFVFPTPAMDRLRARPLLLNYGMAEIADLQRQINYAHTKWVESVGLARKSPYILRDVDG